MPSSASAAGRPPTIHDIAASAGVSNVVRGAGDPALTGVDALLEQRVAGIVFRAFIRRTDELDDALRRAGIPIVFLGLSERWADSVGPRDRQGGKLATEHRSLELGHRRIGYVRTPLVEAGGESGELAAALRGRDAPTALFASSDIGLLERIENPRLERRHESAEVKLRVRGSTAPPRSARR